MDNLFSLRKLKHKETEDAVCQVLNLGEGPMLYKYLSARVGEIIRHTEEASLPFVTFKTSCGQNGRIRIGEQSLES